MSPSVRVLIADDHPLYRAGLRLTLTTLGGCDVVAEVATGEEAVAAAAELRPTVAVLDINMPETNGIDATRRIVDADPEIGVLILTMFQDDDSLFSAMRAGARGYIVKEAGEEEIVRAVHSVADGDAIFGAGIAERLLRYFGPSGQAPTAPPFPELSDRERQILELIAAGRKNPEIAERMFLSPKTVRNQVSGIFRKLQVADRAEAIQRARRAGLGGTGPAGGA